MHIKYCNYEVGYRIEKIKKSEYDADRLAVEEHLYHLGEQGYELIDLHESSIDNEIYVLTFKKIFKDHDKK